MRRPAHKKENGMAHFSTNSVRRAQSLSDGYSVYNILVLRLRYRRLLIYYVYTHVNNKACKKLVFVGSTVPIIDCILSL